MGELLVESDCLLSADDGGVHEIAEQFSLLTRCEKDYLLPHIG